MNLREWYSNSNEFLSLLPADEVSLVKDDKIKVFGLLWNRIRDVINITGVDKVSADNTSVRNNFSDMSCCTVRALQNLSGHQAI